jgi:hypothetical protein
VFGSFKYNIKILKKSKKAFLKNKYLDLNNKYLLVEVYVVCICFHNKNLVKIGTIEKYINIYSKECFFRCYLNVKKYGNWFKNSSTYDYSELFNLIRKDLI